MNRSILIAGVAVALAAAAGASHFYAVADGTIVFSDDFNRADGGPGANYDVDGGATAIASNVLNLAGTGAYNLIRYTGSIANDQSVEAALVEFSATGGAEKVIHLCVRRAGDNSGGYSLACNGTDFFLFDNDGPELATGSLALNTNDVVQLRNVGNILSVRRNGSLVVQVTDSTYTSGHGCVGFYVDNSGVTGTPKADNFVVRTY